MTKKPASCRSSRLLKQGSRALLGTSVLLSLLASALFAAPTRIIPADPPRSEGANATGYCLSRAGITYWERIQDVMYQFDDPEVILFIKCEILNPNWCGSDSCPDYDGSPEYVNAWIDWNGDGRWDPCERVIDEEFTHYRRKSYRGNVPIQVRAMMPPVRVDNPVLRVSLGWGHDPEDPCDSAWTFGDVRDVPLERAELAITVRVVGGNPIAEVPDSIIYSETCGGEHASGEAPTRPGGAAASGPLGESRRSTEEIRQPAGPGESLPAEVPVPMEGRAPWEPIISPTGDSLRFTGTADFKPVDRDSDGLFDALLAEPEFITTTEGSCLLEGRLVKGGKVISVSPGWRAAICTFDYFKGPPGTHRVSLCFSGEDIYRSGEDGPYEVLVHALLAAGPEDSVRISTPGFAHTSFGEIDATIASIWDDGIDLDDDGLFDVLLVSTDLAVRVGAEYVLGIDLPAGIRGRSFESKSVRLNPGIERIDIGFDGRAISQNRRDGPWQITARLTDPDYTTLDGLSQETKPYKADDFEPPLIALVGDFSDRPVDRNDDGLFDALRVTFGIEVDADSAAAYGITAWLGDSTGLGSEFVTGSREELLEPGIQPIDIGFSASAIAGRHRTGRFTVTAVSIHNDKHEEVAFFEPDYSTGRYDAWDFEPGPPKFEHVDSLRSRLEDTDGNGLADYLVVAPLMRSSAAAHLMASATLIDRHGGFIQEGTGAADIGREGEAFVDIRFDGRRIFGSLEDGPYRIEHAHFYSHGGMLNGIDLDLGETGPYTYEQFEPAAVIVGRVEASPDTAALLAEVRTTHSVDWTDITGRYQLVFIDADLDSLLVRASYEGVRKWDIYLNGNWCKTGDAILVPIEIGRVDTLDFLAIIP